MFIWHRVFGANDLEISPEEICTELNSLNVQFRPKFRGDEQGWFAAQFDLEPQSSVQLERYLVREERMRSELNSWCAWLETLPETSKQARVLDALVATKQIFTLYEECEADETPTAVCAKLSRWLTARLGGTYQIDGQGFFDSSGSLLVAETSARAPT